MAEQDPTVRLEDGNKVVRTRAKTEIRVPIRTRVGFQAKDNEGNVWVKSMIAREGAFTHDVQYDEFTGQRSAMINENEFWRMMPYKQRP